MKDAFLGIALAAHELWLRCDARGNKFVAPLNANLQGAYLQGADRIIGPQRSDGYLFTFCLAEKIVHAGCRTMSVADYRKHVDTYTD